MWGDFLPKFMFKSKKKNKFNFIKDQDEILSNELLCGAHTEIFSNKKLIIEGCYGIVDYQENYIKLKLKKGFLTLSGTNFLISYFDEEKIDINGNILTVEFCL